MIIRCHQAEGEDPMLPFQVPGLQNGVVFVQQVPVNGIVHHAANDESLEEILGDSPRKRH